MGWNTVLYLHMTLLGTWRNGNVGLADTPPSHTHTDVRTYHFPGLWVGILLAQHNSHKQDERGQLSTVHKEGHLATQQAAHVSNRGNKA